MNSRVQYSKRLVILSILGGVFAIAAWIGYGNRMQEHMSDIVIIEPAPPIVTPESVFKKTVYPYGQGILSGVLTVFAVSPEDVIGDIIYDGTARSLEEWVMDIDSGVIINAGFFETDYMPSGYAVIDGKRMGTNRFSEAGTGLFTISGQDVTIRDLGEYPFEADETFLHAVQSFPMLISGGEPAISTNRGEKARRSAVGIGKDGTIYLITASAPSLTLYEFMEELLATNIPFESVLNLDGGSSTGHVMKEGNYIDVMPSITPIPNVIILRKK